MYYILNHTFKCDRDKNVWLTCMKLLCSTRLGHLESCQRDNSKTLCHHYSVCKSHPDCMDSSYTGQVSLFFYRRNTFSFQSFHLKKNSIFLFLDFYRSVDRCCFDTSHHMIGSHFLNKRFCIQIHWLYRTVHTMCLSRNIEILLIFRF